MSRSGYLYARRRDRKFDRAIRDAFADANDRLLEEAHRRAMEGHSDRLLIFLIDRYDRWEARQPPPPTEYRPRESPEDLAKLFREVAAAARARRVIPQPAAPPQLAPPSD